MIYYKIYEFFFSFFFFWIKKIRHLNPFNRCLTKNDMCFVQFSFVRSHSNHFNWKSKCEKKDKTQWKIHGSTKELINLEFWRLPNHIFEFHIVHFFFISHRKFWQLKQLFFVFCSFRFFLFFLVWFLFLSTNLVWISVQNVYKYKICIKIKKSNTTKTHFLLPQ